MKAKFRQDRSYGIAFDVIHTLQKKNPASNHDFDPREQNCFPDSFLHSRSVPITINSGGSSSAAAAASTGSGSSHFFGGGSSSRCCFASSGGSNNNCRGGVSSSLGSNPSSFGSLSRGLEDVREEEYDRDDVVAHGVFVEEEVELVQEVRTLITRNRRNG